MKKVLLGLSILNIFSLHSMQEGKKVAESGLPGICHKSQDIGVYSDELAYAFLNSVNPHVQDMVNHFSNKNIRGSGSYPNAVLLYGSSGTGKSSFGLAVSRHAGVPAMRLSCVEFVNSYKDNALAQLVTCVERIADAQEPYVIILDDFQVFLKKDMSSSESSRFVALLNLISRLKKSSIFMAITSSSIEGIHNQFAGKVYLYEFTEPNSATRKAMIDHLNQRFFLSSELTQQLLPLTKGLNLNQITQLFDLAKSASWHRAVTEKGVVNALDADHSHIGRSKPVLEDFMIAKKMVRAQSSPYTSDFWKKYTQFFGIEWFKYFPAYVFSAVGLGITVYQLFY